MMNRLVSFAIAQMVIPVGLFAQVATPPMHLESGAVVSGANTELYGIAGSFVRGDGSLVLGDPAGLRVLVIDPVGKVRIFGTTGEGPGELRNVRNVGPTGAGGFWVSDARLQRV